MILLFKYHSRIRLSCEMLPVGLFLFNTTIGKFLFPTFFPFKQPDLAYSVC